MSFMTPASAKLHSADDPWPLTEQTVANSDKIRGTRLQRSYKLRFWRSLDADLTRFADAGRVRFLTTDCYFIQNRRH
jgi:hypothetical protein